MLKGLPLTSCSTTTWTTGWDKLVQCQICHQLSKSPPSLWVSVSSSMKRRSWMTWFECSFQLWESRVWIFGSLIQAKLEKNPFHKCRRRARHGNKRAPRYRGKARASILSRVDIKQPAWGSWHWTKGSRSDLGSPLQMNSWVNTSPSLVKAVSRSRWALWINPPILLVFHASPWGVHSNIFCLVVCKGSSS